MMLLPSGVQFDHVVVGAVEGELARLAAGGGNHVDVVVALAIGGESDPVAVGREARKDVARLVVGEALHAGAVLIGDPQVAQVAEGHFAVRIGGVAEQFHLRLGKRGQKQRNRQEERFSNHANLRGLRDTAICTGRGAGQATYRAYRSTPVA